MYNNYLKRVFDIIIATLCLVVILPITILIIIMILLSDGTPIFFLQERPGLHKKIFKVIKFRSMHSPVFKGAKILPDNLRVTRLGKFLRKTSLDEIPQLLNVIKGEMSLVGPRPLAVKYLPYYTEEEMTRHNVRPGITGLAQINGRNAINWDLKLKYDIEYVNRISFRLDIYILFITLIKVLNRSNTSSSGFDGPGDFDVYRTQKKK